MPSKYVQVTMEKKGTANVPISGVDDKRAITATFSITFDNKFLPMQLIYKGKTHQSLPKVDFPPGFSLSVNEKHFSNEKESLKFFEEIILPYIEKEREILGSDSQRGLLIFDVFRGQTTDSFFEALKANNVIATKIPPNMTHLYQPLDLTVNKFAKDYTQQKFGEWFSRQINIGLENGQELDDIEIDYRLSVLKPLHAKWLISLYNHMSSQEGKEIIASGWKKSGIYDALKLGSKGLPPLDPFDDICPLMEAVETNETLSLASLFPEELDCFRGNDDKEEAEEENSEWESDDEVGNNGSSPDFGDDDDNMRNAFDTFLDWQF